MKPTVGRTVHYVAYGTPNGEFPAGACRAAVVTEIETDCVGLCVMNPTGFFFNRGVKHDEGDPGGGLRPIRAGGTWHWPEREPES